MKRNSWLKRTAFLRSGKPWRAKRDPKLEAWSKLVKQRDDYICQRCGSVENVHAHHVATKGRRPDKKYDVSNGITLCKTPCHKWVHDNPIQAAAQGWLSTEAYEAA